MNQRDKDQWTKRELCLVVGHTALSFGLRAPRHMLSSHRHPHQRLRRRRPQLHIHTHARASTASATVQHNRRARRAAARTAPVLWPRNVCWARRERGSRGSRGRAGERTWQDRLVPQPLHHQPLLHLGLLRRVQRRQAGAERGPRRHHAGVLPRACDGTRSRHTQRTPYPLPHRRGGVQKLTAHHP